MRAILIGLGDMGMAWYELLTERDDIALVAVADQNPATFQAIKELGNATSCRFYTDAATAMDEMKPDIVCNVTPPSVHNLVNLLAFERNIPVLCEKPIAENDEDVRETISHAQGQKLMIAENYRYMVHMRWMRKLVSEGKIGEILSVRIDFSRFHSMENYHMKMEQPLLLDVGIHHLDALRYLTGDEAESVFADLFHFVPNHYSGYASAVLYLKMKTGAKVIYSGSLDSHENNTDWFGDWCLTGTKGVIRYTKGQLFCSTKEQVTEIPLPENTDNGMNAMLDEFIAYVQDGILPETHISDNIKSFNIVRAAIFSHESRKEWVLNND